MHIGAVFELNLIDLFSITSSVYCVYDIGALYSMTILIHKINLVFAIKAKEKRPVAIHTMLYIVSVTK